MIALATNGFIEDKFTNVYYPLKTTLNIRQPIGVISKKKIFLTLKKQTPHISIKKKGVKLLLKAIKKISLIFIKGS